MDTVPGDEALMYRTRYIVPVSCLRTGTRETVGVPVLFVCFLVLFIRASFVVRTPYVFQGKMYLVSHAWTAVAGNLIPD